MKYAELKNEYHPQIANKKLGQENINIVDIAGILWRYGALNALKNAAFFKDFGVPYLQRDTDYGNDTNVF